MLTWILLGMAGVYLLAAAALAIGLLRVPEPPDTTEMAAGDLPTATVIVAARNEERDLPRCIASLLAQDYPTDRFEVLLVDDRSTDGTGALMQRACAENPHLFALNTADYPTHLHAKARAVAMAAQQARNEWFVILDADAHVPPGWLRGMMSVTDAQTGMVAGPVIGESSSANGVVEKLFLSYAIGVVYGIEGLGGEPVTNGPNMAIHRDSYFPGGLPSIPFRVAEDITMWRLNRRTNKRVAAALSARTLARVAPVEGFVAMFKMHKRWIVGGATDGPVDVRLSVFGVGLYAFVGSLLPLFTIWTLPVPTLAAVGMRALGDFLVLAAWRRRLGLTGLLRWFPVLEAYVWTGFLVIPLWAALAPKVSWSGSGYTVDINETLPGEQEVLPLVAPLGKPGREGATDRTRR
jgi:1,2-diacylglycerol 3-beta-glucosyltransferase